MARAPKDKKPARLHSTDEVAAVFNVHPQTIREWADAGKIPGYRADSRWRFDLDEVRAATRKNGKSRA